MTANPRGAALAAIALAAVLIAGAYGSLLLPAVPSHVAPWLLVAGTELMLLGLVVLGAARPGRSLAPLLIPLALTALALGAGFGLLLTLPPADPADPALVLGLPPRAAVVLYGIGLVPVLILPLAYALTFREVTLTDEDLARVRAAARRERGSGGAAA